MKVIGKGCASGGRLAISVPAKAFDQVPPYFLIEIDTEKIGIREPEKGYNHGGHKPKKEE